MVWICKSKSLLISFSTWVFTEATISTKRAHRAPTFVTQYTHPIEISCTVGLQNVWFFLKRWFQPYLNLILISVPSYCSSLPRRGWDFSSPSSTHSELVQVSGGMFCDETPAPIHNFAIFLPVIFFLCFSNNGSYLV